jgi:hypothetical protein
MAQVIDMFGRVVAAMQPKPGYTAFEATGRPELHLFLVFRDRNSYLILRYADLESIESAPGEDCNRVALLRFRGSIGREVRIEGRRLLDLVNHLQCHRVAWIEETPLACQRPADATVSVNRILVRKTTGWRLPPLTDPTGSR